MGFDFRGHDTMVRPGTLALIWFAGRAAVMVEETRTGDTEDPKSAILPAEPASVRRLGHYELLRELGRGAQGVVFLAEDVKLRRKVALKMLSGAGVESRDVRERFQREAELTSKFEHPGICGVHEVGTAENIPYIAMQYVQGMTLAAILEKARNAGDGQVEANVGDSVTITPGIASKGQQLHDLIKLIEHAARALHVAHEAGLVHRDVKPGNIMVTPDGHPVLLDFGLARDLGDEGKALTQSGQIIGTPLYLAPEQISAARGSVDRRTDVYALGVILFECLTLQRPFDATTWDQLFQVILNGDLPSPQRINPRIPKDLCTIIEVAMERDQTRRYQTAQLFAEDLRRVRAFEPIQAKAAGPLARAGKWSKRNPGRATAVAALLLFACIGASTFTYQALARRQAVGANLERARQLLASGDLDGSLESAARALERDPKSAVALELRTRIERERETLRRNELQRLDLAEAETARTEASAAQAQCALHARRIQELSDELFSERFDLFYRAASAQEREAFAAKERELGKLRVKSEQTLVTYEEALQRAARREAAWGEVSNATEHALAEYYMVRWRSAVRDGNAPWTIAMAAAARQHDRDRLHERELLGRGTLVVSAIPAEAELFLFRYEDVSTLRAKQTIPRLVPVPTTGLGRAETATQLAGFQPGDDCLVAREVAPESAAARAGLRPGDLVVRVQGEPCGNVLFAARTTPGIGGAGPLARVLFIDDTSVESLYDWMALSSPQHAAAQRVTVAGNGGQYGDDLEFYVPLTPAAIVQGPMAMEVQLDCLRDGVAVVLTVGAGEASGLTCEPSAYPLICSAANRVDPGAPLAVEPGSYLVVARARGFATQRLHVQVDRLADAVAQLELYPEDFAPDGFVYVPPGEFVAGGDLQAFQPRLAHLQTLPGFFIARKELTNHEWYEFVNDPETLA